MVGQKIDIYVSFHRRLTMLHIQSIQMQVAVFILFEMDQDEQTENTIDNPLQSDQSESPNSEDSETHSPERNNDNMEKNKRL